VEKFPIDVCRFRDGGVGVQEESVEVWKFNMGGLGAVKNSIDDWCIKDGGRVVANSFVRISPDDWLINAGTVMEGGRDSA